MSYEVCSQPSNKKDTKNQTGKKKSVMSNSLFCYYFSKRIFSNKSGWSSNTYGKQIPFGLLELKCFKAEDM